MEEILQGKPKTISNEKQKPGPLKKNSASESGESSEKSKKSQSSNSDRKNRDLPPVEGSPKAVQKQPTLNLNQKKSLKSIPEAKKSEKPEPSRKEEEKNPEEDPSKPQNKTSKTSKKPEKSSEPEAPQHPDHSFKDSAEGPDNRSVKASEVAKIKDSKTLKTMPNDSFKPEKAKPRAETFKNNEEKGQNKNILQNIDDASASSGKNSEKSSKNLQVSKKLSKKGKSPEKPDNSEDADDEIEVPIMKNPSNNVTEGEILQQLGVLSQKNTSKLEDQNSSRSKDEGSPKAKKGKISENMEKTPSFPVQGKKSMKKPLKSSGSDQAIKVNESQSSVAKRSKNQKQTFGDQFPLIPEGPPRKGSSDSKRSKRSKSSKSSKSSKNVKKDLSSHSKPENVLGQIFVNKANELAQRRGSDSSSPETPNLASPVKPSKGEVLKKKPSKEKRPGKAGSPDSAVWVSPQEEIQKLKQKIKDYEEIIEKQSSEILELKKSQNLLTGPKRKLSPKSSGFLHKRVEGTFLQKNPEMLKRDDFDFWKISEDVPNSKEPQKLEDIAALKDLWILNMESGSQLNSNLTGKKNSGVKANALTKFESNKSANIRNRFLPKISTKKDLSK